MANAVGTNVIDGPAFGAELAAAGLAGLAFSWGADGTFQYDSSITDAQKAAILAVYAAHDPVKAALKDYTATVRYAKETGGITVSGAAIATDRQSQALIAGACLMAQANSDFTTQWKGSDGKFVSLNATQIIAIAQAVGTHVASCFGIEATLVAGIDATPQTIGVKEQIDTAFA